MFNSLPYLLYNGAGIYGGALRPYQDLINIPEKDLTVMQQSFGEKAMPLQTVLDYIYALETLRRPRESVPQEHFDYAIETLKNYYDWVKDSSPDAVSTFNTQVQHITKLADGTAWNRVKGQPSMPHMPTLAQQWLNQPWTAQQSWDDFYQSHIKYIKGPETPNYMGGLSHKELAPPGWQPFKTKGTKKMKIEGAQPVTVAAATAVGKVKKSPNRLTGQAFVDYMNAAKAAKAAKVAKTVAVGQKKIGKKKKRVSLDDVPRFA